MVKKGNKSAESVRMLEEVEISCCDSTGWGNALLTPKALSSSSRGQGAVNKPWTECASAPAEGGPSVMNSILTEIA